VGKRVLGNGERKTGFSLILGELGWLSGVGFGWCVCVCGVFAGCFVSAGAGVSVKVDWGWEGRRGGMVG